MWTVSTIGFFSVVQDRQKRGFVLVRARAKADIWNLYRQFSTAYKGGRTRRFKMTKPKAAEHRDYRWRVGMKQRDWAAIVYRLAMRIDYGNFKDAVHDQPDQSNKNSAYLSIWSAMLRVQHMEDPGWKGNSQPYFYNWDRELDYAAIGDGKLPATVQEFDERFDAGESLSDLGVDLSQAKRIHELSDQDFTKQQSYPDDGTMDSH
jgi:hypothetical protein